jgi:hypothetical protein
MSSTLQHTSQTKFKRWQVEELMQQRMKQWKSGTPNNTSKKGNTAHSKDHRLISKYYF